MAIQGLVCAVCTNVSSWNSWSDVSLLCKFTLWSDHLTGMLSVGRQMNLNKEAAGLNVSQWERDEEVFSFFSFLDGGGSWKSCDVKYVASMTWSFLENWWPLSPSRGGQTRPGGITGSGVGRSSTQTKQNKSCDFTLYKCQIWLGHTVVGQVLHWETFKGPVKDDVGPHTDALSTSCFYPSGGNGGRLGIPNHSPVIWKVTRPEERQGRLGLKVGQKVDDRENDFWPALTVPHVNPFHYSIPFQCLFLFFMEVSLNKYFLIPFHLKDHCVWSS